MAKIRVVTIIDNGAGTIYCAGFVKDKYTQILGSNNFTIKDLKVRLLEKYKSKKEEELEKC